MSRQEIMEMLGEWFGIEPNEDGTYNIKDYDWQAGCYMGDHWFSLAEVVLCLEAYLEDYID